MIRDLNEVAMRVHVRRDSKMRCDDGGAARKPCPRLTLVASYRYDRRRRSSHELSGAPQTREMKPKRCRSS